MSSTYQLPIVEAAFLYCLTDEAALLHLPIHLPLNAILGCNIVIASTARIIIGPSKIIKDTSSLAMGPLKPCCSSATLYTEQYYINNIELNRLKSIISLNNEQVYYKEMLVFTWYIS